jgi:putative salt-induced outer membrane protein YdiY
VRRQFMAGLSLSLIFSFVLLFAIPVVADQIVMKNGDKLTGSITKSDGKTVVLKTDYAGDLTIKFDAIQSLSSTGDLHVTAGGKTEVGPVSTSGAELVVATKSGSSVEVALSSVTVIRSPAEEVAFEKSQHPGFGEGWVGGLNLGFALTTGNSETKNLNIAVNGVRTGLHDKLTLYENTIYAVNDKIVAPATAPQTTANSSGGGIRYDRDFVPRVFGFGSADFFSNSLQDLNLRAILGGGIGFHMIKNAKTTLDILAGGNYTHESYADVASPNPPPSTYSYTQSLAALTLGDAFNYKLGKSTVVTQGFLFYPDLSDTSQYRFTFNLGTVTKLNKWLGWQNSIADIFVSRPPIATPAIERNDLQISTGLNFSFKH